MAKSEKNKTSIVLDLVYSLPKQKQYKLIKELLSNLNSDELNKLIPQNNVDIDRINFFNNELKSNYKSLDGINWSYISQKQTLSENFIREFQDKVDWRWVSRYQKLSESFIREFQSKVDWYYISYNQTLSEEFIREFKDKVDWVAISHKQTLSEEFIREFENKVAWEYILKYQKVSKNFIEEFKYLTYSVI